MRKFAKHRLRQTLTKYTKLLLAGIALCATSYILLSQSTLQTTQLHALHTQRRSYRVAKEDLVIAVPSDEEHVPLIQASYSWRKGIRTVVAVNDSQLAEAFSAESRQWQEYWIYWPDDEPLRGKYRGDTRAALVPFLAHQVLGDSYKWLLYGDDDTQWFLEGVLKLVKDLDPNMPYFLSGQKPEGRMEFNAPEGCPCSPDLLCKAAKAGDFDADCNIPRHLVPAFSTRTYSMHGGAGGLLSIGLLRTMKLEDMEKCIADVGNSTGGDAFITICLWRQGFAHTDPGPFFNDPTMRLFDAAAHLSSHDLAARLSEKAEGICNHPICQAGSIEKAAEVMTQLSQVYQAYTDMRIDF